MWNHSLRLAVTLAAVCLLPSAAGSAPAQNPPAPYSLPWQLRPIAAGTVVRVEETIALFNEPSSGRSGSTLVTTLTGSWKWSKSLAPVARVSWVANDPPSPQESGAALSNPLLGLTLARASGSWKQSGFVAMTFPLGGGGGDSPEAGAAAAVARGVPARSSMDNALYATNQCTVIAGAAVACVEPQLTAQAEVTLLRLFRARGPESVDVARTNSTVAFHFGRFFTRGFSVGTDLRYQRWLTQAAPVRAAATARENVTIAVGPRFHFKIGDKRFMRPGIAWARSTDRPFSSASYDMIQLDVPFAF